MRRIVAIIDGSILDVTLPRGLKCDVQWNLSQFCLPRGGGKKKKTGVRTVARFVCFNKLADFHDTLFEGYLDFVCLNSCVDGCSEMAAVCMFGTKA